ncbi:energy-coupling factor transporter ATPase [Companilactobacillus kedongensis]|uniref:energy-coupling factor transporter ATPase n=1 Tax=Companilactobacillus kedongensis TaxID=2486004 RepID=UPI000F7B1E4B|nr:energy-coupling factor transporter ATPase [Companilactobacillus kedongensis]
MIRIEELVHKYTIWNDQKEQSKKIAIDGLSLNIKQGEFLAILGSNGSGKSTLAKHLNALLLPSEGTVKVDDLDTSKEDNLTEIRNKVGMVFQNPDNQIIGTNVEEDVAFGLENKNMPSDYIQKRVAECINTVGMSDFSKTSPTRLSGGQKQRVAIAGAFADDSQIMVLDEPTSMLDPRSRSEIIGVLHKLNTENGMTIILITHNTDEVVAADRIVLMNNGKIVGKGSPSEVFANLELLREIHVEIPQIIELGERLRKSGLPLSNPVLNERQLVNELTGIWEE